MDPEYTTGIRAHCRDSLETESVHVESIELFSKLDMPWIKFKASVVSMSTIGWTILQSKDKKPYGNTFFYHT